MTSFLGKYFNLHLHFPVLGKIKEKVALKAGKKLLTVGMLLGCCSGVWCLEFSS